MTRPPRLRKLTDEEILLWRAVAETVDVRQAGSTLPHPMAPPFHPIATQVETATAPAALAIVRRPPKTQPPPLVELDRRARQKIVRGKADIERRIDLHGMTQAVAHAALRGFLRQAHMDDLRLVLVVTGKGDRAGAQGAGVLKRLVPHWLGDLDLRPMVLGFETAGTAHGGAGALYIRLRRRKILG